MSIEIVTTPVSLEIIRRMADEQFGDFVKAVVDVRQGVMAIGGELHADEEAVLLQHGARQTDLWGINLYPGRAGDERAAPSAARRERVDDLPQVAMR